MPYLLRISPLQELLSRRHDGGARAYRGKTDPAEVPVTLLPVARARPGWRALGLQAKQECVAMQVFTACLDKTYPGLLPSTVLY
ncbi:MAG: hypothetical protein WAN46_00825 [Gammaproteobacteria bacterium]